MYKRRTVWVVLGLALGLSAAVGLLLTDRIAVQGANLPHPATAAYPWTLTWDAFEPDEDGSYRSRVLRAPFAFTAAGVHLAAERVIPLHLAVQLRLRAEGGAWSPWYGLGEFEPEPDGRLYGESLVTWPRAREVQVRLGTGVPWPELLSELTVVAIDASAGPTTSQAVRAARTRVTASAGEAAGLPQPTVISRAEWGANESWMTWPPDYAPVDKMILHHTASGGGGDPAAEVRAIYYYHAVTRGWGDIGYNFLVDRYGNLYEGRFGGVDVIGAHVAYWNEGSLGVSVLGCYDYGACGTPLVPTAATLDALIDLVAWTSSRRGIDPRLLLDFDNGYSVVTNYVLAGHRDYGNTVCPGGNLYAELPDLRDAGWARLPEYDARFGWHDTPLSVGSGQRVTVHANVYNYGRLVWRDDEGVRLGYRWLQEGQVVAENTDAARILPGAAVNLSEMTALVAQLVAPAASGVFTLRWDLYRDGVGWFADQPAPDGRSQPLDLTVEVVPELALGVRLEPFFVAAGDSPAVEVVVEGPQGHVFETHTLLSPPLHPVAGSGQSDLGTLYFKASEVSWVGAFETWPAAARFNLVISGTLSLPVALPITTTLSVGMAEPLILERWLIVNGYNVYLPLIINR